MPKPYSYDLRVRVIDLIEAGSSRRDAAELYGISPRVVVIWSQRWKQTGSISAKPSGGSISPLEEHAEFLLGLNVEQPDLTLDEVVVDVEGRDRRQSDRSVAVLRTTRHQLQKNSGAEEQRRADVVRARRRWMRQANLFLHYAFDLWMKRTHPYLPWCRYADDGLVHRRTKQEAEALTAELQARLAECSCKCIPPKRGSCTARTISAKDRIR
jgi:hypothetical protein